MMKMLSGGTTVVKVCIMQPELKSGGIDLPVNEAQEREMSAE